MVHPANGVVYNLNPDFPHAERRLSHRKHRTYKRTAMDFIKMYAESGRHVSLQLRRRRHQQLRLPIEDAPA